MILFLLNLLQGSLAKELQRFFCAMEPKGLRPAPATPAAVCIARKKIQPSAFQALQDLVVDFFYRRMPWRKWKGFRVVAMDGSTLSLPKTKEIQARFGTWGNPPHGEPGVTARISLLHDVLNHLPLHGILVSKSIGERELAKIHGEFLRPGDLWLMDRGYAGYWIFQYTLYKGAQFLCRLPTRQRGWKVVHEFLTSNAPEAVVTLRCPSSSVAQCRALGLPTSRMTVRLIRVERPEGEVAVLATSLLDASKYPAASLAKLYALRWDVEENGYKVLKCRVEVERFTGKSVLSVQQDFHAKLLLVAIASVFRWVAQHAVDAATAHRKHRYSVNFSHALATMKDHFVALVLRPSCEGVEALLLVLASVMEPVRPGRHYPRHKRVKNRHKVPAYKHVG